jgi:hypothetical protein
MKLLEVPLSNPRPTNFRDRGVAVPFTTPILAGARVRPGQRDGLELVIPNPSGARGVYVVPWSGLALLCAPTLHDRRLSARIAHCHDLSPASVRLVARAVAGAGFAGQEAATAATTTEAADLACFQAIRQELARTMLPHVKLPAPWPAEVLTQHLSELARRLGRSPTEFSEAVDHIARLLLPLGYGPSAQNARLPTIRGLLDTLRADLADWAIASGDMGAMSGAGAAGVLALSSGIVIEGAGRLMDAARAELAPALTALLDPALPPGSNVGACVRLAELAARPDWLLDGWESIGLIWQLAGNGQDRRTALQEMLLMAPRLPDEATTWLGTNARPRQISEIEDSMAPNVNWRTWPVAARVVERNERIRALAA